MLDNGLFWNVLTIISSMIEGVLFRLIVDEFSKKKRSMFTINFTNIILITMTPPLLFIVKDPNIRLIIYILFSYLFYLYNYEDNILKKIIVCLIFWMIFLGLEFISLSVIMVLNSLQTANQLLGNTVFRVEVIVLSKTLLISIIFILKVFKIKFEIDIKLKDFLSIIIPILTNIISVILIFSFRATGYSNYNQDNIIIFFVSILLLISNMSFITMIRKIIHFGNLRIEHEIIKEKMKSQFRYYSDLQHNHMKIRKLYHDMNNHIACIESLNYKNDLAEKYLNNVKEELNKNNISHTTGNLILDIILNDKKHICEKNSIEFRSDINFSKCEFIDMIDICSIFANILDNAIEACEKINGHSKEIRLVGNIVNNFYVIKCENTKTNKIITKENKIFSDKKNTFKHGIGLSSINNTVEKYNGHVAIDYTNDKFIINICIPLS